MKNDEKTRRAANHAAMRINIGHLAFDVDADDLARAELLTAGALRKPRRNEDALSPKSRRMGRTGRCANHVAVTANPLSVA
jgi:hypothetical protein